MSATGGLAVLMLIAAGGAFLLWRRNELGEEMRRTSRRLRSRRSRT